MPKPAKVLPVADDSAKQAPFSLERALRAGAPSALRELLDGFLCAERRPFCELLPRDGSAARELVCILVRILTALIAEALSPATEYGDIRSLWGLFEALRREAASAFDQDSRFDACERLSAIFRDLFGDQADIAPRLGASAVPRISDRAVLRVLETLLVFDGAPAPRELFRAETLGAFYEGLIGLDVRAAKGACLTLLPDDAVIDMDELVTLPGPARLIRLQDDAGLDLKGKVARAASEAKDTQALIAALAPKISPRCPALIAQGQLFVEPTKERRRRGAHYTSREVARLVVLRALSPLFHDGMHPEEVLSLRVCDPAMGSGAFLVTACDVLAERLVAAWKDTGSDPSLLPGETPLSGARRLVAERCLYGVDKDPVAVELAKLSLWLITGRSHALWEDRSQHKKAPNAGGLHRTLRHGDSLLGVSPERLSPSARERLAPFHWEAELPEVFSGKGGFDAMIGNPPWVSYAGRAAQPLSDELRSYYLATSVAFAGYRNLQGIFVERAAGLLRPGGRLGFVLPTSMSDLAGYEPSRRAHDAMCICDPDLPDLGDVFDGVFQPSMGLLSTRRPAPVPIEKAAFWPLVRSDLDPETAALLDRIDAFPKLPSHLFGERGFQTTGEDTAKLAALAGPEGAHTASIREGVDVRPFLRLPPRLYCDPSSFRGRFRPAEDWQAVRLWIRQTARYPMVCCSDGTAFRNSILAGFEDERHRATFLLAYLNSAPVRWFHYVRHRDARQGMPQLKIGHLRALPDLPEGARNREAISRLGARLGAKNSGISMEEQAELDALVSAAWGLSDAEKSLIARWASPQTAESRASSLAGASASS